MIQNITTLTLLLFSTLGLHELFIKTKCHHLFIKNSFDQITLSLHIKKNHHHYEQTCNNLLQLESKKNKYVTTLLGSNQKIQLTLEGVLSNVKNDDKK